MLEEVISLYSSVFHATAWQHPMHVILHSAYGFRVHVQRRSSKRQALRSSHGVLPMIEAGIDGSENALLLSEWLIYWDDMANRRSFRIVSACVISREYAGN